MGPFQQVRGVHRLLGDVITGLMHTLVAGEISNEQGCALVQGLDCWARLVQQQRRSKQKSDAELPLFRSAVEINNNNIITILVVIIIIVISIVIILSLNNNNCFE